VEQSPVPPPEFFQDRVDEVKSVTGFLASPSERLLVVHGPTGIGKSTLVSRALKQIEEGAPPGLDGRTRLAVFTKDWPLGPTAQGLYEVMSAVARRKGDASTEGRERYSVASFRALLRQLRPQGVRILLLLDPLGKSLDPKTGRIKKQLAEMLRILADWNYDHPIKVIITSSSGEPADLKGMPRDRYAHVPLEGLTMEYRWGFLKAVDVDGKLQRLMLPRDLLKKVLDWTWGSPIDLDYLYRYLTDPTKSLEDLVRGQPDAALLNVLVGKRFQSLRGPELTAVQALAVFSLVMGERGVPPEAVEFLLGPLPEYFPAGVAAVLDHLVTRYYFLSRDRLTGGYMLRPADRDYALGLLPEGDPQDWECSPIPLTRHGLLGRAALFFHNRGRFERRPLPRETLDDWCAAFTLWVQNGDFDFAARLLGEMEPCLQQLAQYEIWQRQLEALKGKITDPLLSCNHAVSLGVAYLKTGQIHDAIRILKRASRTAQELGQRSETDRARCLEIEREALNSLGGYYLDRGEPRIALRWFRSARDPARELGDRDLEVKLSGNMGSCWLGLGRPDLAGRAYRRAMATSRDPKVANRPDELHWRLMWSWCESKLGHFHLALDVQRRTIAKARRDDYQAILALGLLIAGNTEVALGRRDKARVHYEEALKIQERAHDISLKGETLHSLAELELDSGAYEEASRWASESLKLGQKFQSRKLKCQALYARALASLHQGRLEEARTAATTALRRPDRVYEPLLHALLGVIAFRQDDRTSARAAFEATLRATEAGPGQGRTDLDHLYARGLALGGLTLCGEAHRASEAAATYGQATAQGKEGRGRLDRNRRLLEALDREGTLDAARRALRKA